MERRRLILLGSQPWLTCSGALVTAHHSLSWADSDGWARNSFGFPLDWTQALGSVRLDPDYTPPGSWELTAGGDLRCLFVRR